MNNEKCESLELSKANEMAELQVKKSNQEIDTKKTTNLRSWHIAHHYHQYPQDYTKKEMFNADGKLIEASKEQAYLSVHNVDFNLIEEVRLRLKAAIDLKIEQNNSITRSKKDDNCPSKSATDLSSSSSTSTSTSTSSSSQQVFNYSKWHYDELMDEKNPYTCWRYIQHTRKSIDDCICLMLAALEWRYHNQVDPCMNNGSMIKEFWHMTPVVRCGKDKAGNSVYCIIGRHYRKPHSMLKDTIRAFIVNLLFEWDRIYTQSFQKLTIIFDVSNTGYQNIDLDYMSWMVSIRDFLPSRIANIYVIGIPFLIRPIVRLIISWLPENFRNILQCGSWQELVLSNIDENELPIELGGSRPDERLAPPDAPWWCESELFEKDKIEAIEWCIGFSCDQETRDKRRQMQLEFEASLALPKQEKKLLSLDDNKPLNHLQLSPCTTELNKEKLIN